MYKETYKGKYRVNYPKKYKGDINEIIYRSSWELKFMKWCDLNPSVLEWGSETMIIPYKSPVDKKIHRYFVDFFIKIKDKDKPITKLWCFSARGYDSSLVEKINSGKQVVVQKVPKPAWDFVEEVKKQVKKKKENK